jgi:steroid delta-isomerase-like uncharacterized protein
MTHKEDILMSAEENKAVARRFYEDVWNQHDVDALDELTVTDAVDHDPMPGQVPGREGWKQQFAMMLTAFPDLHFTVDVVVAEGDKVASRLTVNATHSGEFMGLPPTGKQGSITGVDIFRIAGGKVVERWGNYDLLGLMQQIGAVAPPG